MGNVVYEYRAPSGQFIKLVHGDITDEQVDAIVNAANAYLQHGGGVAGAIVRKGGHIIQEESDRIGYVPVGQVAMTTAGALSAKAVIHAVGPQWGEGDEDRKLRSAVWNSLLLAHEQGFTSIAIPAISSGIFGFPKDRCARILIQTALDFCEQYPDSPLREIRFTIIDRSTVNVFMEEMEGRFGSEGKQVR
ncbi:MAG TPA: macro domain-containing protein [Armatimonadetes bacterium]|nr:macro domain-containing protein [Armatimonadota bacterium]